MRPLSLVLSASVLLLASSAGAQTQNYPSTESESISQVQVVAPSPSFQFRDYEAEAISGAYAMSNGWRMKVDPTSEGIVAQIDRQHPIKLVALSRDLYASRDGNVSMEFNRGVQGDEMLMSYMPAPGTGQVAVVTVMSKAELAQR